MIKSRIFVLIGLFLFASVLSVPSHAAQSGWYGRASIGHERFADRVEGEAYTFGFGYMTRDFGGWQFAAESTISAPQAKKTSIRLTSDNRTEARTKLDERLALNLLGRYAISGSAWLGIGFGYEHFDVNAKTYRTALGPCSICSTTLDFSFVESGAVSIFEAGYPFNGDSSISIRYTKAIGDRNKRNQAEIAYVRHF